MKMEDKNNVKKSNLVILGASNKPQRYSYKVLKLAIQEGIAVYPVHPFLKEIEGVDVYANLPALSKELCATAATHTKMRSENEDNYLTNTVTLYVRKEILMPQIEELVKLKPHRVIANPGADDAEVVEALRARGLYVQVACTLVLLTTGQFRRSA